MTVRELREFLSECNQDIQVVGVKLDDYSGVPIRYGVVSVEQVKPYSCHDEPEYPEVVEIEIG